MGIGDSVTRAAVQVGVSASQVVGSVGVTMEVKALAYTARGEIDVIAKCSKRLPGPVGHLVASIAIKAEEVVSLVASDPEKYLRLVRSFFDYNLGHAKEVVLDREKICQGEVDPDAVKATEATLQKILGSFDDVLKKCREHDAQDAQIHATSLSRIIDAKI